MPSQVSAELRERIETAIKGLNYVPDPKARALASGRTNVIGVLIPSLSNIVFADVLRGVHDAVAGTDYQIQIGNMRYLPEEEDRLISLFVGQRPAGLIVTGIGQSEDARRLLVECRLPIVQIMEIAPDPVDMMVGFSHERAGEAAAEHLIAAGYSRIGFVGARMDPRVRRRQEGFRAALRRHKLYSPEREITTRETTSVSRGRALLQEFLARDPTIDAVFCANDDLALGALFECKAQGLDVPGRIGIMGFNDLEMMAAAEPSMTSVRTRRYEMGRRAVEMVMDRLHGRGPEHKTLDLGFELVARDSTARPPASPGRPPRRGTGNPTRMEEAR